MTNPLDDRPRRDPGSIIVNGEVVPTDIEGFVNYLNGRPYTGQTYFVGGTAPHRFVGSVDRRRQDSK